MLGGVTPDGQTILNVGGAIGVAYGTAANTATQGNDSRVTGALAAATAAATYAPLASPTFTGTVTMPGGTINATSIGATTPGTGAFTTLAASGTVTGAGFVALLAPYALSSSAYTLPAGTSTVLGGVKPDGQTITNSAGAISVSYGAAANTAVQGNDARVTGALAASTAATDLCAAGFAHADRRAGCPDGGARHEHDAARDNGVRGRGIVVLHVADGNRVGARRRQTRRGDDRQ